MRQWWGKLIAALAVMALLLFVGCSLYRAMMGLLGVIASGGETQISAEEEYIEAPVWTPPPYILDDAAYDNPGAVREYDESADFSTSVEP